MLRENLAKSHGFDLLFLVAALADLVIDVVHHLHAYIIYIYIRSAIEELGMISRQEPANIKHLKDLKGGAHEINEDLLRKLGYLFCFPLANACTATPKMAKRTSNHFAKAGWLDATLYY